jgi:D-glycero-D-manno-heptose 1,7-bisphosphate phosphatase
VKDKYVFIDRDGVINKDGDGWTEYGYITRWQDFKFLPGVLAGLKKLKDAGYKSVIVSNQKCVGRGIITGKELGDITDKMSEAVRQAGGEIEKVYYCPHLDEDNCSCRKPKEGLFLRAMEELDIKSLSGKYFIGDSKRDMEAGRKAGLGVILVLSGKTRVEEAEKWEDKPDRICKDLMDAVEFILGGI